MTYDIESIRHSNIDLIHARGIKAGKKNRFGHDGHRNVRMALDALNGGSIPKIAKANAISVSSVKRHLYISCVRINPDLMHNMPDDYSMLLWCRMHKEFFIPDLEAWLRDNQKHGIPA